MNYSRRRLLAGATAGVIVPALIGVGSAFGDSVTYLYDPLGRVIQATFSDGHVVVYTYDSAGNRTQVVRTDGSTFTATLAITGTGPVNLRTIANSNGYSGATDATITFQLGSGVTIGGAATGATPGGIGIDSGTWPSGKTISLTLQISGTVRGGGGTGGDGGGNYAGANQRSHGSPGTPGGDAIYCRLPMTITVNSGGVVKAGGGGGGGGNGYTTSGSEPIVRGGGGGGGGAPNGAGGAAGEHDPGSGSPTAGASGTTSGGGAGGSAGGTNTSPGAAGGGYAVAGTTAGSTGYGGAGGAAGYAIRKNGNTVTVTNSGTITGTVG